MRRRQAVRARRRVHPAPGDRKLQRERRNLHDNGRPLSNALAATVMGPAAMTVADARVEEAANAVVAFAVTLSRTATAQVTIDYTTRDGSPQAGSDYTAKSGTLTFPGRRVQQDNRGRRPRRLPRRG